MTDPSTMAEKLRLARSHADAARVLDADGQLEAAERALREAHSLYHAILGVAETAERDTTANAPSRVRVADLTAGVDTLDARAEVRALGAGPARRRRRMRLFASVLAIAAVVGYFAFALGVRPFARVRASGVFFDDPSFAGEKAVDGQVDTEWLAPDGVRASLDVVVFPSQTVRSVVVVNGHNRHFADRAARHFEVRLYAHGVLVHVARGEFRRIAVPGERVVLPMPRVLRGVDHVRLDVVDSFGLGAAVAELELR